MYAPTLYEISSEETQRVLRILRSENFCYEIAWIKSFFRLFGNLNYRVQFVEQNHPSLVVRVFQSKKRYTTETAAIQAISANTDIPVPEIMAQSSNAEINQHYIITRYIGGGQLQENLALLGDKEQRAIGQQLGEFLAQLHKVKKRTYGNLTVGMDQNAHGATTEADYTLKVLRNLLGRAQRKGVLEPAESSELQTFIDQCAGLLTETIPSLIHGDMIDANILIDTNGKTTVITGILDFEHSRAWSPEVDFTKLLDIRFREHPLLSNRFLDAYFQNMGITSPSALERFYSRLRLFRLIADLQLAVDLAKANAGFLAKLMIGTRHLPYFQYQRLFALIDSKAESGREIKQAQEDLRYLSFARKIAVRSTCDLPARRGAVIVAGNDVRSVGYDEATSGRCQAAIHRSGAGLDTVYSCTSAEVAALLCALRNEQSVRGATAFCTDCPNALSATLLARSGIARVVFFGMADEDYATTLDLLQTQGVEVAVIDPNTLDNTFAKRW